MNEKVVHVPFNTPYLVEISNTGETKVEPITSNNKDLSIFGVALVVVAMLLALAAIIYAIVFLAQRQTGDNSNRRNTGVRVRVNRRNDRRGN